MIPARQRPCSEGGPAPEEVGRLDLVLQQDGVPTCRHQEQTVGVKVRWRRHIVDQLEVNELTLNHILRHNYALRSSEDDASKEKSPMRQQILEFRLYVILHRGKKLHRFKFGLN